MISKVNMFGVNPVADQHPPVSSNYHGRSSRDKCDDGAMEKVHVSFPSNVYQQQHLQSTNLVDHRMKMSAPKFVEEVGLIGYQNRQQELVNNARLPLTSKNRHQQDQQLFWDKFKLHERLVKEHDLFGVSGKKHSREDTTYRKGKSVEDQLTKKLRSENTSPDIVYIDSNADCKKMFPLPMLSKTKFQQDGQSMSMGCLQSFQTKWERLEWFSDRFDDTVADQTAFVTEFFLRSMTANPTGHMKKKIEKIGRNTSTTLRF
jgi:hypothetical protein